MLNVSRATCSDVHVLWLQPAGGGLGPAGLRRARHHRHPRGHQAGAQAQVVPSTIHGIFIYLFIYYNKCKEMLIP